MRTVTNREILASIVIVLVMLTIGVSVNGSIQNHNIEKDHEYNTASRIDSKDLFEYGMRTSVGNAFVYGDVHTVDPVTYEDIGGEYSYVKRVYEEYRKHTRTVTKTKTVNGETVTYTEEETYWTWDTIRTDSRHSKYMTFLGVQFDYKIPVPPYSHIATKSAGYHKRYKYYGSETDFSGTAYCRLIDNDMEVNDFFHYTDIDSSYKRVTSHAPACVFWIFWMFITAGIVYMFVVIDNRWLEDM